MNKGLLTLLPLLPVCARSGLPDTWQFANQQQQQQALNIASQVRYPQCNPYQESPIAIEYAPSGLHHGGRGKSEVEIDWMTERYGNLIAITHR